MWDCQRAETWWEVGAERGAGWGGQRGRKAEREMVAGVHPFMSMVWDLRYRGRGQKIDSFWRKWAPVSLGILGSLDLTVCNEKRLLLLHCDM